MTLRFTHHWGAAFAILRRPDADDDEGDKGALADPHQRRVRQQVVEVHVADADVDDVPPL